MSIERELLNDWMATTYQEPEVQLAAGPTETVTDTGPAFTMPGMGKRSQKSEVGQNLPVVATDALAGGVKGTVAGVAGFGGDMETIKNGIMGIINRGGDESKIDAFLSGLQKETKLWTSDDVSKWLDANVGPVVPKDSGMSPEMQKARETGANLGEFIGNLVADPVVAVRATKVAAKMAKKAKGTVASTAATATMSTSQQEPQ